MQLENGEGCNLGYTLCNLMTLGLNDHVDGFTNKFPTLCATVMLTYQKGRASMGVFWFWDD